MLCSFSLQFVFFSEQPFYGNYSTLDSHINTVISHTFVCLLVKMASKTVIRSIQVSASFIAFGELPSLDTASFIVCLKDKFRSKRFPLLLKPSSRSNFVFNGFDYIRTTISACSSDSLSWEPIKHETKSGCLELGGSPTF